MSDAAEEREDGVEVWFTLDRGRFYLVPRGLTLPRGDTVVRGPLGLRRARVDLEGMAAWEVPRDEALGIIDRRVGAVAGSLRGALGRLVEKGHALAGTTPEDGEVEVPSLDPKDLLGVSAGEVVGEADGARRAVRGMLDRASEVAERIGAGDRQAVRERLGELEHDLLDQDGAVPTRLRALGNEVDLRKERLSEGLSRWLGNLEPPREVEE